MNKQIIEQQTNTASLNEIALLGEKQLKERKRELEKILNRVNYLLSLCTEDPGEEFFYEIISNKLFESLNIKTQAFLLFKKTRNYSKLKQSYLFLTSFLQKHLKEKPIRKTHKMYFYLLFINCVVKYLKKFDIPICLLSILNCYERFPSLLNIEFPGYVESGVLHLLLEKGKG